MVKRLLFLILLSASVLSAEGLSLTIGAPFAAQTLMAKKLSAVFAVRVNGCADPSKAQLTAMAEGIVGNERRTASAMPAAAGTPGAFVVARSWNNEGKWIVAVTAACGNETAGALVPVRGAMFVREGIQMLPHAPTKAEIDSALNVFNPAQ